MVNNEAIENIISTLDELKLDSSIPKNVKAKINDTVKILTDKNIEVSLRVNKALHELDEVTDETNIEPYIRTQIWNIVSMLEMIA